LGAGKVVESRVFDSGEWGFGDMKYMSKMGDLGSQKKKIEPAVKGWNEISERLYWNFDWKIGVWEPEKWSKVVF
jgi:hypothetical protein